MDVSLYTAGIKNLLGRELDGDGDGQPGGVFKFYHLTGSLVVVPNTEIKGRVFASEKLNGQNFPLQGVIGRVAGNENAQVFTGAEGALTLPCPARRFFCGVGRAEGAGGKQGGRLFCQERDAGFCGVNLGALRLASQNFSWLV